MTRFAHRSDSTGSRGMITRCSTWNRISTTTVKVFLLFVAQYKGDDLPLCLARRFLMNNRTHATDLRVLEPEFRQTYKSLFLTRIEDIER